MSERTILFLAEPQSVSGIFPALRDAGVQAGVADGLTSAMAFLKRSPTAVIFSRPALPGFAAEALLSRLAELSAKGEDVPPVIIFSRAGSADEAQKYLELGARDYWLEPLGWEKISLMLPEAAPAPEAGPRAAPRLAAPRVLSNASPSISRLASNASLAAGATTTSSGPESAAGRFQIIGRHPAVQRVLALARQVARSKATVLISGPSGTGKEMFARFIHHNSDRAREPFVAINCAALPEHLLESELFGHEKGAFTGAINRKLGKFELAQGGTILLDEITEMDLALQAKLLRVLQEGEIDRVGGVETIGVDVRVLATTNRDLDQAVREGAFRQDLFYRLNVIPLRLPALHERGDDVLLLSDYFAAKYATAYGMGPQVFAEDARSWLASYDWPGNVRELQNLMERAVLLAQGGPIQQRHFLLDGDTWGIDVPEMSNAPDGSGATDAAPT
ncbi:MAG: sigma-54 dependent transcriptional regulator, partial [Humidesulfovibrio sp.]|nr:sigma-54 dependent transcriptional regulator [Humidesulfovibrio sp.]